MSDSIDRAIALAVIHGYAVKESNTEIVAKVMSSGLTGQPQYVNVQVKNGNYQSVDGMLHQILKEKDTEIHRENINLVQKRG
jgi:hypothetical protein